MSKNNQININVPDTPPNSKKHHRPWTTLALMDCVELRSLKMSSGSLEKGARVLNG